MEFWSTICDQELKLNGEDEGEGEGEGEGASRGYIREALPHLVPMLTEGMCRQQKGQDDDTWNLAMASATCLSLVAQVARDDVVGAVMPWVEAHVRCPDWRPREAAMLAFGSITEGWVRAVLPKPRPCARSLS